MSSVYPINKGVNRPVVFRGLKAQYIWYLCIGLGTLLVLFTLMYVIGVAVYFSIPLILVLGTLLFYYTYRLNHRYGQFGMMKKMAKQVMPKLIKCDQLFQ